MWGELVGHEEPDLFDVVQTLQAEPKGFRAGFTIAFASQKTAQAGDHPHRRVQVGRLVRRLGEFVDEHGECLPFGLFEKHRAGQVRSFPSELGQMEDPPGHHQVNGQAGFDAILVGEALVTANDPAVLLRQLRGETVLPSARS